MRPLQYSLKHIRLSLGGGREETLVHNWRMERSSSNLFLLEVLEHVSELFLFLLHITSVTSSTECKRKRTLFKSGEVRVSCCLIWPWHIRDVIWTLHCSCRQPDSRLGWVLAHWRLNLPLAVGTTTASATRQKKISGAGMQGSCLVWQNYLHNIKMAETNRKFDCSWNIRFPID